MAAGASDANQKDLAGLLSTEHSDALRLNDTERLILELYDQEEELRLEQSLYEAQNSDQLPDVSTVSDDELDARLAAAEREALEARAGYTLRRAISNGVIMMNPALRAVHAGSNASPVERRLLPLIVERDVLAMLQGALSTKVLEAAMELSAAEREHALQNEKNRELAQALLQLAEQVKEQKPEEIEDAKLRRQALALDAEMRDSRRRWRVMKSLVAGIIVGSGIDWAADEELVELVLDDEAEMG